MTKPIDIPELVDARADFTYAEKDLADLEELTNKAREEVNHTKNELIQLYKSNGISQEDCDHPFRDYAGQGEEECPCCDKRYMANSE